MLDPQPGLAKKCVLLDGECRSHYSHRLLRIMASVQNGGQSLLLGVGWGKGCFSCSS
jgi:hypothetical protein